MKFLVDVVIKRKQGVADPEGNTIKEALERLGYDSIREVGTSRLFSIQIEVDSPVKAKEIAEQVAEKVLANPVIEKFSILNIKEII